MAPENVDVSGFFTKHEWKLMREEIRHGTKCMYVLYKQGKIEKPDFIIRHEKFKEDLKAKEQAAKLKTPEFRIQQQKARMRIRMKNKVHGVEQCLKGFTQLEIDASARKKELMDGVVQVLEHDLDTDHDSEPVYIKKRRLRRIPGKRVNYMELQEQEDDAYTWCDECSRCFLTFCPLHGPLLVVPDDKTGATELGCPPHVALRPSGIPGAGRGAWATEALPAGLRFGPYKGQLSKKPNPNSQYSWQIRQTKRGVQYVDGENLSSANWMRFVNCCRNAEEQNLLAYQYKGSIYYRTVKNIFPDTELLVWYGPQIAKLLNIDVKKYYAAFRTPPQDQSSSCTAASSHLEGTQPTTAPSEAPSTSRTPESFIFKVPLPKERPYMCQVCNHCFLRPSSLQRHSLIHSGEKPFSCDECTYSCAQAYDLKRHKLVHTEEKLFSCGLCKRSFNQSRYLSQHLRRHHKM